MGCGECLRLRGEDEIVPGDSESNNSAGLLVV